MWTFVVSMFVLGYFDLIRMHLPYDGCDCSLCRPSVYLDELPLIVDYGKAELVIIDECGQEISLPAAVRGVPAEDRLEILVVSPWKETKPKVEALPDPKVQHVASASGLDTI